MFLDATDCIFRREENQPDRIETFQHFQNKEGKYCTELELQWEFRGTKCDCWLGFVQDEGALALLE